MSLPPRRAAGDVLGTVSTTVAKITGIDIKEFAPIDINGRQIKNAIRLSQTLAKSEGKKVETATLRKVINLMTAFDRERSEASSI